MGKIDWDCEVKSLFQEENMGCGLSVSSAATLFFEQVEMGKIMKVLHVNTYDSFGGAEKIAYTLYKNQASSKLIVKKKLKYFDDKNIIEFEISTFEKVILFINKIIWKFGLKKGIKTYFQAGDQFNSTYRKLRKLKVYQEADIIHLHNIHGNYFDLSALAKIAKEKKIIWTMHDMWAMTGGEAGIFNVGKGILKTYMDKNMFYHYPLNGPVIDKRKYFINYKKSIYKKISENLYLVPVSGWLRNCLEKSIVYNKNLNVEVVYNGIDSNKFIDKKKRVWTTPRVLFFNSNSPFKGSNLFTDCLEKLKTKFELTIIGDNLTTKVADNIEVKHLGRIDEEDRLINVFNDVDILVFPSVSEAFGLLPAEAMSCGVMVLSSDAGGLKELVKDGVTGKVFKNGDKEDLVRKIEEALNDLESARKIGAYSREFVSGNFPLSKMINSYEQLYLKA